MGWINDLDLEPGQMLPMSAWWMMPQFILQGVSNLLIVVGLQEFFYSEMPNELRSLGSALYLSIFGIGCFLSGILISLIDKAIKANGGSSWFLSMAMYLYFASSYVYRVKHSSSLM